MTTAPAPRGVTYHENPFATAPAAPLPFDFGEYVHTVQIAAEPLRVVAVPPEHVPGDCAGVLGAPLDPRRECARAVLAVLAERFNTAREAGETVAWASAIPAGTDALVRDLAASGRPFAKSTVRAALAHLIDSGALVALGQLPDYPRDGRRADGARVVRLRIAVVEHGQIVECVSDSLGRVAAPHRPTNVVRTTGRPSATLPAEHERMRAWAHKHGTPGNRGRTFARLARWLHRRGVPLSNALTEAERYVSTVPQHGHRFTLSEAHATVRTHYGHHAGRPTVSPARASRRPSCTPHRAPGRRPDLDGLSLAAREALAFAERGHRVLPLRRKRPLLRRGFHDASSDPEQVAAWAERWPHDEWGVVVGEGLAVVDIDPRHGADPEAVIERHGLHGLPTVSTGLDHASGLRGAHVYADAETVASIAHQAGVDLLGTRGCASGYVVLPGSLHASGVAYAWADDRRPWTAPSPRAHRVPEAERIAVATLTIEQADRFARARRP